MTNQLSYDVFVADPVLYPTITDLVPNGDKRAFSPLSITLISGERDAVLVDPPLTVDQTKEVGDWVESTGKRLTHIVVTHGHGDHWFGGPLLADRFGAAIVATSGTIEQMHRNVAMRSQFWDALFPGMLPDTPVTATTPDDNTIELEGNPIHLVETGHTDTDETSVIHVPSLGLVVAGDAIYNGVHQYLREARGDGIDRWLEAIGLVEGLNPAHVVAGHKNKELDDDAARAISETRDYLQSAKTLLTEHDNALGFFNAMLERYPARLNAGALWSGATTLYA